MSNKTARRGGRTGAKASMILVADEAHAREALSRIGSTERVQYTGTVLTDRDGTGESINGVPIVASLRTAAKYICRNWVDEVFVIPASLAETEVHETGIGVHTETDLYENCKYHSCKDDAVDTDEDEGKPTVAALIEACRQMAVPVHIRLPISNIGNNASAKKVCGYKVITIASNRPSPAQMALKRVVDIAGGLVGSLIAIIVIAVVSPMIKKESPGPVLFCQTRIGMNGRRFRMYKIRTMDVGADEQKPDFADENRFSDGMMFKLDFDPRVIGNKIVDGQRVTGLGERLRVGSWDEWPQCFNILLGQMSLVGTRPPTVDEWEKYQFRHRARLAMKPGLTGLWQVIGRNGITNFEDVVKLDTEYIDHWSMGLDIRILLKTIRVVFTRDGAM